MLLIAFSIMDLRSVFSLAEEEVFLCPHYVGVSFVYILDILVLETSLQFKVDKIVVALSIPHSLCWEGPVEILLRFHFELPVF